MRFFNRSKSTHRDSPCSASMQKVSPAPAADAASCLRPGCVAVWPGKAIQGSQLAWWLSQPHLRAQLCLRTRAVGTGLNTHKVARSVWTRECKANTGIVCVSRGVFKCSWSLESSRYSCKMKCEWMFNIINKIRASPHHSTILYCSKHFLRLKYYILCLYQLKLH